MSIGNQNAAKCCEKRDDFYPDLVQTGTNKGIKKGETESI